MQSFSSDTSYQLFVGVDIAAVTATVAGQAGQQKPSKPISIEQTPESFDSLHHRLMKTGARPEQILVVMEATGVYWLSLATFFARLGYAVSVVNPAQAHHFAKALLKRAKTDAIDAQTLTRLAALLQPEWWTPPPALYEELEQRLTQRESLLLMRGQLRNQLHALGHLPVVVAQVRQRMEALDQTLTTQIATIETELAALLPTEDLDPLEEEELSPDRAWARTLAKLQTIPGIGLLTALWIVVTTMNFTLCSSAEQAAAMLVLLPCHENPARASTSIAVSVTQGTGDCAQPCIWQPSLPHATIPSSNGFMTGCVPLANRRRWPVVRLHANCCTWPLRLPPTRRILTHTIKQSTSSKQRG